MNERAMQRTRYVLHSRFRSVGKQPLELLAEASRALQLHLDGHPVLRLAVARLRDVDLELRSELVSRWHEAREGATQLQPLPMNMLSSREQIAAFGMQALDCLANDGEYVDSSRVGFYLWWLEECRRNLEILPSQDRHEDALGFFSEHILEPLFEYLDEQLDERNMLLFLLRRYAQRASHFDAASLREIAATARKEGNVPERALLRHLHRYLFDQSVDIAIEPWSPGGEADIVLRDADGNPLAFEGKHLRPGVKPSKAVEALASGFHQASRYAHDHGAAFGVLLMYNEDPRILRLDLDSDSGWEFLEIGGTPVYVVEARIAEQPTASKAPTPTQELVIPRTRLLESIDASDRSDMSGNGCLPCSGN